VEALVYEGPGRLQFRDEPAPRLTVATGALIRPTAVATCDLDRYIVRGLPGFDPPFILGHEFVGEIMEVGEEVARHRVGDRVAVAYQPSCGTCRMCRRGISSACREVPKTSTYGLGRGGGDWGGALADLVLVPYADFMLAAIPDGVSERQAASASDNVADAYRCVLPYLADDPGAPVLIAGNGAIPLMAADSARRLGAGEVNLYSQQPAVLARADALGINAFEVDQWPRRFASHPIAVDCTSDPDGMRAVIASTEAGGHCISASMHFTDVSIPMLTMYMKGITLHTGRTQGASVLPQILEAIAAGTIDPLVVDPLVAEWSDAPAALLADALKAVVDRAPTA
jgi:threonine dehydrogenase-like Zn-dependent dehydrogenase